MTDSSPKLETLLAGAQLPALPQSAIRLLELSQDPDNGPAEFAVPIETDPGLAGQVLRFVNSSYFGFSREISSVKLAITLVGIRTIKNFALWSAVFSLMPNPKCGPFNLKSLWQDSLRRGLFARLLGKAMGLADSEDLFAAALLQDMAVPLLAKELPSEYLELFEARHDGVARLGDLEQERFGWDHADAGGIMARSWSLPQSFASLIESHNNSRGVTNGSEVHIGTRVVAISAHLPSAHDSHWCEASSFLDAFASLSERAEADLPAIFGKVDVEFEEFAPLLKLGSPPKSLVESLEAERPAEA